MCGCSTALIVFIVLLCWRSCPSCLSWWQVDCLLQRQDLGLQGFHRGSQLREHPGAVDTTWWLVFFRTRWAKCYLGHRDDEATSIMLLHEETWMKDVTPVQKRWDRGAVASAAPGSSSNSLASSAHCPTWPPYNLIICFPAGAFQYPKMGLTTPGRETGSLRLDTRRLARQQIWDHLELIKRNYNNYIKMVTLTKIVSVSNSHDQNMYNNDIICPCSSEVKKLRQCKTKETIYLAVYRLRKKSLALLIFITIYLATAWHIITRFYV